MGPNATVQYYHQDGLGSVVAVSNATGATDATNRYDAWGNKSASTGTTPQYGYTGREPDATTGLVYYRGRYYDPSQRRFTQRDPIGLGGGLNRYAYVQNNPINFNDPNGLLARDVSNAWTQGVTYFDAGIGQASSALSSGFQSLSQSLYNTAVYGMFKTDAGLDAWGAGLQNAQASGSTATADYFRSAGAPGSWMKDAAAFAVTAGGSGIAANGAAQLGKVEGEAFHYTLSKYTSSIEANGLRPGSFATSTGELSPLQAQLNLALPPNRGLTDSILRIDLNGLRGAGYEVPQFTQAGRMFNMPGGGMEMQFPFAVPPEFISVIK